MPRVRRAKPTEEERLQEIAVETRKTIKMAMAKQDIRYAIDLAAMVGIDYRTLSAKLKNGTWTQKDLVKIIAVLKIPTNEAIVMLGLRPAC